MPRDDEPGGGAEEVGEGGERPRDGGGEVAVVLSHVEVAAAVELDDAGLTCAPVGCKLLVVDGFGGGDVEAPQAGVVKALLEVGLVGVDEEPGVDLSDLAAGLRAH